MRQQSTLFWLTALALGWCADLLFWRHTPGISFAVYVLLTLTGGLALLFRAGIAPKRSAWLLLGLIAFFAAFTFIRAEAMSQFLSHVLTLLLMALLVITYRSGDWPNFGFFDYLTGFFRLALSGLIAPLRFWLDTRREASAAEKETRPASQFWPIVRGVALALPVLAFFASLLASADAVFSARLTLLLDLFRLENLPEYLFRAVYVSLIAWALAGVYLHAEQDSQPRPLIGAEKPLVPAFLGFTEASIVLGSIVSLFAVFVVIQFQYFFGGQANINLQGFTYAEYARRGFGELVGAAFFSLLLLLTLAGLTQRKNNTQQQVFGLLAGLMTALVGVMLVSAYQRLALYEIAYGFSALRLYTHIFIFWLAGLMAAALALVLANQLRRVALACLLAALGFSATLLLLNVDGFIVRQNVARNLSGSEVDVAYLASLSSDAIPTLVRDFNAEKVDVFTHERLGAALLCARNSAEKAHQRQDTSWQAFHLSRFWAQQSLNSVNLQGYTLNDSDSPASVTVPGGQNYSCSFDYLWD